LVWLAPYDGTFGVFALGNATTTTNIYTFSTSTVIAGTALATAVTFGSAAGNVILGIFEVGDLSTGGTNIYTYTTSTVVAGAALTATSSVQGGAACR